MEFLESLGSDDRERLLAASVSVCLERGDVLIRRGECGGDMFLVEAGTIEVVDSRERPEVVLEVLGPGRLLGVLSFVDGEPRSTDVRAASAVQCRRWGQADLRRLLGEDTALSGRFYAALSGAVVKLTRQQWSSRTSPVGSPRAQEGGAVPVAVAERAREIAQESRQAWMDAEVRLRASSSDEEALEACRRAFGSLVQATTDWIGPMGEHDRARSAGEALLKEVQPYLGRAKLVMLAQEAGLGANGAGFMAHLLLGEPSGDGPLGNVIDQALLALPTVVGVRGRQRTAVASALADLTPDRPLAVTVVQPNCGALLAKLVTRLSGQGAEVTVIDGDRETLGVVDLGMHKRPVGVSLRLVQEDLARLSAGHSELNLSPQDAIVIDGLIDHLPDRMVASVAGWCATNLADGGRLVFTAVAPAMDQSLFDHLVGWPLMRRTDAELLELIGSAGLDPRTVAVDENVPHAGVVVVAGS